LAPRVLVAKRLEDLDPEQEAKTFSKNVNGTHDIILAKLAFKSP
jgi:hypothetical protein